MSDPYALPNGTLRNRLGITERAELEAAESDIAAGRQATLDRSPLDGPFDFQLLCRIHRVLFGDIYDWAGTARTSILAKSDFMGPGGQVTAFAPPRRIVSDASRIFDALKPVEALAALSRAEFAAEAASLLVQINNLHPFREGNGRAQRSFIRHLAAAAGHDLAWDVVTHERMVSVSIAGARGDGGPMLRLLAEVLDPDRVRALRKALGHLRRHWAATWNDIYIATTVAGQVYSGVLVGRAPPDFMMRVEAPRQGWIAIGGDSDLPAQAKSGDPIRLASSRW